MPRFSEEEVQAVWERLFGPRDKKPPKVEQPREDRLEEAHRRLFGGREHPDVDLDEIREDLMEMHAWSKLSRPKGGR